MFTIISQKELSRAEKAKLNSLVAIIYLTLNFVSGFILPKLIITYYGSAINGLVNSINQFLQIFTFLDMGLGVVIVSSLYSPIARGDDNQRNMVISSGVSFYRNIGGGLVIYVIALVIFFPMLTQCENNNTYIVVLIIAMSMGMFGQYYFGLVDRCILTAYQKDYIYNFVQSVLIVVTTLVSVVLIVMGYSIETIKIAGGIIGLLSPIYIRYYLNRTYNINRHVKYLKEPIEQKWNGVTQHISYIVCQSTDVVVLTVFSTLENVSVYAVYNLVSNGLSSFVGAILSGAKALMGDLNANNENEKLRGFFRLFEWFTHNICVIFFSCATCLIVDFVCVYTDNISDANYIQPLFGPLFMISTAVFCLRIPYNMLVQAMGHYRQTQNSYIISAVINIIFSIILVNSMGLVGVVTGTLSAMLYQSVYLARYCYNELLMIHKRSICKLVVVDILCFFTILLIEQYIFISISSYMIWVMKAFLIFVISFLIVTLFNIVLFRDNTKKLLNKIYSFR